MGAIEALRRPQRRRGLTVVISDFLGPTDWERPLRAIAGRHDVLGIEVVDPRDLELPDVGDVVLHDPESVGHGNSRPLRSCARILPALPRNIASRFSRHSAGVGRRSCHCIPIVTGSPTWFDSSRHAVTALVSAPELGAFVRESFSIHFAVVAAVPRRYRRVGGRVHLCAEATSEAHAAVHQLRSPREGGPVRPGRWRHVSAILMVISLVFFTVALAGPTADKKVPRNRATVILVIDVSLSMQATDVEPTRLAAAQEAAKSLPTD